MHVRPRAKSWRVACRAALLMLTGAALAIPSAASAADTGEAYGLYYNGNINEYGACEMGVGEQRPNGSNDLTLITFFGRTTCTDDLIPYRNVTAPFNSYRPLAGTRMEGQANLVCCRPLVNTVQSFGSRHDETDGRAVSLGSYRNSGLRGVQVDYTDRITLPGRSVWTVPPGDCSVSYAQQATCSMSGLTMPIGPNAGDRPPGFVSPPGAELVDGALEVVLGGDCGGGCDARVSGFVIADDGQTAHLLTEIHKRLGDAATMVTLDLQEPLTASERSKPIAIFVNATTTNALGVTVHHGQHYWTD